MRTEPQKDPYELVTIYRGELSELLPLEASLRALGFHPFIADQNIKTIDPFITAGRIFEVRLQAPRSEAEEIIAAVHELRAPAPETGAADDNADEVEDEPADGRGAPGVSTQAVTGSLERLGSALQWGMFVLCFFAPFPVLAILGGLVYLVFGVRYLSLARRTEARPAGHPLTATCISIAVVVYGCLVLAHGAYLADLWAASLK